MGNSPDRGERLLRWFDNHIGQPHVTLNQSTQVFRASAQSNPPATLAWLEANAGRIDEEMSEIGFSEVGREWQSQTPEKLAAWMESNAGHPRHDTVVEAAVSSLTAVDKIDAAIRLAESIRDETRRNRLITALKQSTAGESPQK